MKPFEFVYLGVEPFLLPLHKTVRKRLARIAHCYAYRPEILDVGGRKSHYTTGVRASITVTDVPRESEVQHQLHLGTNSQIIRQVTGRRSNIKRMMLDDMTRSSLPDNSFDCVVAVEVLEHVEEDELFLRQVCRVLKPGSLFLMTTPNGDAVENTNPDHKRHYTHEQLYSLLSRHFAEVEVEYAIKGGRFRKLGLRPWSPKQPLQTVVGMASNIINYVESTRPHVRKEAQGTRHLIATARKQGEKK